jgi:hypothetical protein
MTLLNRNIHATKIVKKPNSNVEVASELFLKQLQLRLLDSEKPLLKSGGFIWISSKNVKNRLKSALI